MADGGWIKIYRSIQSHWLWENGHERYAKWWMDILLMVNHEPKKMLDKNGNLVTIRRGETMTSERKLAEKWNASRVTVHRFLDLLVEDDMIEVKRLVNLYTTLKVNNYNAYQDKNAKYEPGTIPQTRPGTIHDQELKELKNTMSDKSDSKIDFKKFIEWFNQQTGKHFKNTDANQKLIKARLNEGNTKQDLADVVEFKSSEWKDNPEMNKYLRFNTLFAPTHFGDYLNEAKESNIKPHVTSNQIEEVDTEAIHRQQVAKAEEKWRKEHPDE